MILFHFFVQLYYSRTETRCLFVYQVRSFPPWGRKSWFKRSTVTLSWWRPLLVQWERNENNIKMKQITLYMICFSLIKIAEEYISAVFFFQIPNLPKLPNLQAPSCSACGPRGPRGRLSYLPAPTPAGQRNASFRICRGHLRKSRGVREIQRFYHYHYVKKPTI